jgi:hypothetical protein
MSNGIEKECAKLFGGTHFHEAGSIFESLVELGKKPKDIIAYIKQQRAAHSGDAKYAVTEGLAYFYLTKDYQTAREIFEEAIKHDDSPLIAHTMLGFMYEHGFGVLKKDENAMFHHYQLAADRPKDPEPFAQFLLGSYYQKQAESPLDKTEKAKKQKIADRYFALVGNVPEALKAEALKAEALKANYAYTVKLIGKGSFEFGSDQYLHAIESLVAHGLSDDVEKLLTPRTDDLRFKMRAGKDTMGKIVVDNRPPSFFVSDCLLSYVKTAHEDVVTADRNMVGYFLQFAILYEQIDSKAENSKAKTDFLALVRYCFRGKLKSFLSDEQAMKGVKVEDLQDLKKRLLEYRLCTAHRGIIPFGKTNTQKFVESTLDEAIKKKEQQNVDKQQREAQQARENYDI